MPELERYDPTLTGRIKYEHYHRYAFAAQLVAGLDVLDVASGEGYGSAMLAGNASHVTGVDIDPGAISAASARYGRADRLKFVEGSAHAIPFGDARFDAVISFETIEHIDDPAAFLSEIRRVLKPGGFAVISTPNKQVYNDGLSTPNHFHVSEMDMGEFVSAVEGRFNSVATYGQRMVIASAINPALGGDTSRNSPDYRGFTAIDDARQPAVMSAVTRLDAPEYILCVATDGAQPAVDGSDSVFLMREHDLWREHAATMKWASGLHEEDEVLRAELRLSKERLAELSAIQDRLAVLAEANRSQETEIAHLNARPGPTDMSALAPLLEDISGESVPADVPNLVRLLNRLAVERAKQELRLADFEELKTSSRALAGELTDSLNRQREAEDLSRSLAGQLDAAHRHAADAATAHAAQTGRFEADLQTALRSVQDAESRAALKGETIRSLEAQHAAAIVDADSRNAELHARLDELSSELASLTANLEAEHRHSASAQADHASEIEHLNGALQESLQATQLATQDAEARLESLGRLESLHAVAVSDVEERNARIDEMASHLAELTGQLETANGDLLAERRSAETSRADLLEQLDLARAEAVELLAQRDMASAAYAELQKQQIDNEASRPVEAPRPPAVRPAAAGRNARPAVTGQGAADTSFAIGLRERIQQAALAEVEAYRSGFAAAATVRAARNDIQNLLKPTKGVGSAIPQSPVRLRTGEKRPISQKAKLRALLKNGLKSVSPPTANAEAIAALFDPHHYVTRNSITPAAGETPFAHYVRVGRLKGLSTHPLIDADWIRGTWPDAADKPFDLFTYVSDIRLHDRHPHPLFEADHYRRMNRDVAEAGLNPLAHYLTHGWREDRSPNQMFDNDWYLATHSDVMMSGVNPLLHYVTHGAAELRKPHPLFDHGFYLHRYPDVAASGQDGYTHFIAHGRGEGRLPCQKFLDMQRLERFFDGPTINDLLLLGDDPERRLRRVDEDFWPPKPGHDYWLPQGLRDFIIDRLGEEKLQLNAYLFSLIDRYGDAPDTFDFSEDCERLIARARALADVPLNGRPKASIIVPVYNNLLYTLTCIISVLESAPSYSFEILVGDDQSKDRTPEAIKAIGGLVRLVRHAKNLGFLGNCNAAAKRAVGEHIVFLNNDTIVFPGWLDRLVETLDGDPDIGFVGSKLLNGDGTLQEAGGIFWKDGSAWNFGRNADPMAPEFNYLKDVDYVSGASIALPARLWRILDGFDPIFTPAYCEDSDLAFRVRKAGYRTVYDPHSVLVHHEGRSHGRDVASGIKAYQVINQQKLLERWGDTLLLEHFPNAESVFLARDRSRQRPHILIVDHYAPQWDQDAGSRTMFHFIRAFVNRGFQVTFWPDNLNEDRTYVAPLQRIGVEVIYGPSYVGRFSDWLSENGRYLDYAFLSRPHISENYIDAITNSGIKKIYYGHDLHCMRSRSTYDVTGDRNYLIEADQWEQREVAVSAKADVVMYPGLEEIAFMATRLPPSTCLIRPPITIFDSAELDDAAQAITEAETIDPYALMFVGGFSHTPNGDGITWFLDDIWPKLRAADERFTLRIAGSKMPDELRQRGDPGVDYLGRVSDEELTAMYSASGAAIVPLRYGGGIKGKVIEAFARGVPVIMTDVGAQGIPDAAELGFVSSADWNFADAVLSATRNRTEALARARRAVMFLRAQYSEQAFCNLLENEIPELAGQRQ